MPVSDIAPVSDTAPVTDETAPMADDSVAVTDETMAATETGDALHADGKPTPTEKEKKSKIAFNPFRKKHGPRSQSREDDDAKEDANEDANDDANANTEAKTESKSEVEGPAEEERKTTLTKKFQNAFTWGNAKIRVAKKDEEEEPASDEKRPRNGSEHTNVVKMFQRFGSKAFPEHGMKKFFDAGFTGETYADMDQALGRGDPITILHFNDVYNIEPGADGTGGISRFVNAMRSFSHKNPLILFSGDLFNPSSISSTTKGWHMIPVLKMLKVHTACIGNHDFDFGVDHLEYLIGSSPCPWLLSNVFEAECPSRPLADGKRYRLLQWQDYRIGIMGLVEREWLETLSMIEMDEVKYVDYVEAAKELCAFFKSRDVDLIIALTHMRAHNDERLAREVPELDLVLGGHDHEYYGCRRLGRAIACKSGTDFREFTALEIIPGEVHIDVIDPDYEGQDFPTGRLSPTWEHARDGGKLEMPNFAGGSTLVWRCVEVNSKTFPTNRHVDKLISKYVEQLARKAHTPLGLTACDLDTRFAVVRTSESNAGNWLTDLMTAGTKSDIAILNSGTLRADRVIPAGVFTIGDMLSILPMPDPVVVLELSGARVLAALENSVCMFPAREGRFLQVSGLRFAFDPEKPGGSRVVEGSVLVRRFGETQFSPLEVEGSYRVATKEYMASGKDGFDCLVGAKVLLDAETSPTLNTLLTNSFTLQSYANELMAPGTRMAQVLVKKLTMAATDPCALRQSHSMAQEDGRKGGQFVVTAQVEGRIVNIHEKENQE